MDQLDDFEMRPLTQGLGFHNRKKSDGEIADEVKREVPKSNSKVNEDQELQELMSALDRVSSRLAVSMSDAEAQEKSSHSDREIEIVQPLPRKANNPVNIVPSTPLKNNLPPFVENEPVVKPQPIIQPVPLAPQQKKKPQLISNQAIGARRGAADAPVSQLRPAVFSFSAAFLDTMMVLALSLMFLITLLLVTGVKLAMVFKGVQTDIMTQASMFLLYVSVLQLYVIVSRSFFGKTLGEWTFEYQMGDDKQINSAVYPLLVLWRSLIIMATGVVTLPLLSVIFRKDLASYLTGLQFYKKS